ncbi:MAG: MotA/TolQ/ExbB proton channel family protein [Myxococcota bacterium]
MHALAGLLLTVLAFVLAELARTSLPFSGLFNPAALTLLIFGPIAVSLISHPFADWVGHLRVLLRAFRHRRAEALSMAAEEMSEIGRAVRESRWDEAASLAERARSEAVASFAPFLARRYEGDALADALASTSFRWMNEVRGADEFFQGLGRVAPAFGMIGTIMGLVDLFAHMRDSASLGPGMAMALLATLYGLVLCYCVYLPLAVRVRSYLGAGIAERRALERAIHLIAAGRPIHEARSAFFEANTPAVRGPLAPLEAGRER